jgi:hypothetical protein
VARRISTRGASERTHAARTWRYLVGTFQINIPVDTEEHLLPAEETTLAIMKWRLKQLSRKDRWYPVLVRYLSYLESRVNAFGGNASAIPPSPLGLPHGLRDPSGQSGGTCQIGTCPVGARKTPVVPRRRLARAGARPGWKDPAYRSGVSHLPNRPASPAAECPSYRSVSRMSAASYGPPACTRAAATGSRWSCTSNGLERGPVPSPARPHTAAGPDA